LACGNGDTAGPAGSGGAATGAGGGGAGGATTVASGGASASGGAGGVGGAGGAIPLGGSGPTTDAGLGGGPATLADGGPFDCTGCACDGLTHFCATASGGKIPPAPDASACEPSETWGCVALPESCGGVPTCACLLAIPAYAVCHCDDVGGGLLVRCMFP
jgi:hypothetical protein